MRVLIDTNVLFSALLFPKSKPADALFNVVANHTMVLSDRNIAEFREIILRKKPELKNAAEAFLAELSFELIPAVSISTTKIRDIKDQPILNAAVLADVDIILTGDKDFLCLDIDHPRCITAAQFLSQQEAYF